MNRKLSKYIPEKIRHFLVERKQMYNFNKLDSIELDPIFLPHLKQVHMNTIFEEFRSSTTFDKYLNKLSTMRVIDDEGGVNPGDRLAIYFLIQHFKPTSILEIGTHIGASTVYIASSLKKLMSSDTSYFPKLITVDIKNVNDVKTKPWLSFNSSHSPLELIQQISCEEFVTFIVANSLEYLGTCRNKFDFIFLDGDHSASYVYQEIAIATKLLNKDGQLLLHDYYPDSKPLWKETKPIKGPFLAVERLKSEGVDIIAKPLGKLPWITKKNSELTSLALIGTNH